MSLFSGQAKETELSSLSAASEAQGGTWLWKQCTVPRYDCVSSLTLTIFSLYGID